MYKRKKVFISLLMALLAFISMPNVNAAAMASKTDIIKGGIIERDELESTELHRKLAILFPDEYVYVMEYDENGIDETISNPEIVFEDSRSIENESYTLTVYNNRLVLLSIETEMTPECEYSTNSYDARQKTKSYKLGDLNHYVTFNVTYTVNYSTYDVLDSCTVSGYGFYLYPYNKRSKKYENAQGNAYFGYVNSSMNYDGSGVLYDLGVVVGHDSSKGVCRLSTGVDAFITYMLNPFIWG